MRCNAKSEGVMSPGNNMKIANQENVLELHHCENFKRKLYQFQQC